METLSYTYISVSNKLYIFRISFNLSLDKWSYLNFLDLNICSLIFAIKHRAIIRVISDKDSIVLGRNWRALLYKKNLIKTGHCALTLLLVR